MTPLGTADLDVFPLCLGGNVFGWTADEQQSFAVLDAYAAAGGNFIDTADSYSAWVPGNEGGESEAVLGRWMAARGNREQMIIATKVGRHPAAEGLAGDTIRSGVEASLRRLGTDYVDLYWAHADDENTPLEETLGAFDALVKEGKARHLGASNHTADRLAEALDLSARDGLSAYVAVQPGYNLLDRTEYEGALADLCAARDIACVPYFGLANGFLTGKYRPGGAPIEGPRAPQAQAYLDDPRGPVVLDLLDEVAAAHETTVAAVALAWLGAQPTVAAPIASARSVEQLADLLPMATLELTADELGRLADASA